MTEKTIKTAMSIILNAGDARNLCKEALQAIEQSDFGVAKVKLKAAQHQITLAHQEQTEAIQDETRGGRSEYSLLFAHAQDTLMTVNSEINIAKQMIHIFEKYDERLKKLEERA